jgi:hypothetical protein
MTVGKPKWQRSFTNAPECKYMLYEFVHTELVQVFYDIKWISSGTFEFEKKQQSLKIDPGTQQKLGMLNVIKQLQHFILCNMMCYEA